MITKWKTQNTDVSIILSNSNANIFFYLLQFFANTNNMAKSDATLTGGIKNISSLVLFCLEVFQF